MYSPLIPLSLIGPKLGGYGYPWYYGQRKYFKHDTRVSTSKGKNKTQENARRVKQNNPSYAYE